jgi:hypothetical protein
MYILREDIKDMNGLIRWLEDHMFIRSEYSCKKRNTRAVAIHFGGPYGTNHYIFCSDRMCNSNPYISWLDCRKRYWTEEEFESNIQVKLDEQHDIRLRMTLSEDMVQFLKNCRKQ